MVMRRLLITLPWLPIVWSRPKCSCVPIRRCGANVARVFVRQEMTMPNPKQLAFTVMWEASEGSAEVAADIIARFAPEARKESGLELLMVNRCMDNTIPEKA